MPAKLAAGMVGPAMLEVRLEQEDWNRVLAVLAQAPWSVANPLILAIGGQLKQAQEARGRPNGPFEAPDDLKPPEGRQRAS